MAKTTAKTATAATETNVRKVTEFARKGALAYVGLHVAAYERVKPVFAKTDSFIEELVVKGEAVEAQVQAQTQGLTSVATTKATEAFGKVRSFLPKAANDRVEELEGEIAALNNKIAKMAKKTAKKTPVAKAKTIKTVKTTTTAKTNKAA